MPPTSVVNTQAVKPSICAYELVRQTIYLCIRACANKPTQPRACEANPAAHAAFANHVRVSIALERKPHRFFRSGMMMMTTRTSSTTFWREWRCARRLGARERWATAARLACALRSPTHRPRSP
eukprot:6179797-Pleurochrysis_carterae.AAC.1